MNWLEFTIRYAGIMTLMIIALAGVGLLLLTVIMITIKYTPRLHIGKPTNDGELCFYDPRTIITGKTGERVEGSRRLITDPLRIKWWVGLSKRNSSKWFVGYIRWEPKP